MYLYQKVCQTIFIIRYKYDGKAKKNHGIKIDWYYHEQSKQCKSLHLSYQKNSAFWF